MIVIILCFSLAGSFDYQSNQITFWLDFLNSSLSLPSLSSNPKWTILLVGVRQDEQQDQSLTQNPKVILSWKKKWSKLPLYPKVFTVSSLKSPESVKMLLEFVEGECNRIFEHHATQIPSIYQKFLLKLKEISIITPLISWKELFDKSGSKVNMSEQAFKTMLQYIQFIGRIVWLPNGTVFTDPTIVSKIAAKFISPKEVRLALLKKETEVVQILDESEIGSLLNINLQNNRYFVVITIATLITFNIILFFFNRLSNELDLLVHLKICFKLHIVESNLVFFLFPSLSTKDSSMYLIIVCSSFY